MSKLTKAYYKQGLKRDEDISIIPIDRMKTEQKILYIDYIHTFDWKKVNKK